MDTFRGKHKRLRHDRKRKRSRSHQRKRKRRSGSRRCDNDPTEHIGEMRKLKYKEKGGKDRSSRRRISNKKMKVDIASTSTCNHKRSKKGRDEEYYSDVSDSSEYEDADTKRAYSDFYFVELRFRLSGQNNRLFALEIFSGNESQS